ncbi:YoaK family protein [Kitasatospora sp. NPDC048365]|uniref:YoaK family protein n=1 Tax=Kitasatospora sp. NPDC048365 TaxID=3364050 RepID=UPI0037181013
MAAQGTWMFPGGHTHARLGPLLLVLTFAGGLVDAVSFLDLGKVFVANMTGNVAFLGLALAGVGELSAPASGTALAGFLAGAAVAGRVAPRAGGPRLLSLVVGAQAALVAVSLGAQLAGAGRYPVLVPLALGMGLQNGVVHRLALPDLPTTVVTRGLAGLAADPLGPATVRRGLTALALFLGALTGGLLHFHVEPRAALAAVLALLLAVAVAAWFPSRGER